MKILISLILSLGLLGSTYAKDAKDKTYSLLLSTKNTMVIRGSIGESSMVTAQMRLAELNRKRGYQKYKIYIVFDSPGGSIRDGEDFIDFAKTFRDIDTVTIFAASMASAIIQALPGRRFVTHRGVQMYHRAKGGFRGQFETGEVESALKLAKTLVRSMETRSARRIGLKLSDYKARVVNEWWLFGRENLDSNTADYTVQIKCSQSLIDKRESSSTQGLFGSSTKIYSGCPLIRGSVPDMEK